MKRSAFLPGFPAVVVCLGFADLLGGCQAPPGGVSVLEPGLLARSDCGAAVIPDGLGDYDVLPSGDLSGATDGQNIRCALEHMRSGGVTTLDGSDFYLNDGERVTDVLGTLRGRGRDATTLHAVNDYGADQCTPKVDGQLLTFLVLFFYDDNIYSGALTVSDLSVTADGYAVAKCRHGTPVLGEVWYGIVAAAYTPGPQFDVDLTFEHLGATATLDSATPDGSTLGTAYATSMTTSGDVKVGDVVTDKVGSAAFVGWTRGAHIVIGGSDQDAIVARNVGSVGAGTDLYDHNDVEISHVYADHAVIGIFVPNARTSNSFTVTDNTLEGVTGFGVWGPNLGDCCVTYDVEHNVIGGNTGTPDGIGIEDRGFLRTGVKAVSATVSNNTVDLVTPYRGIYGLGVQDMVVSNNTISGHLMAGICMSTFGEPVNQCALLGNNVQSVEPWPNPALPWITPSQIYLGPGTKDCVVVGGSNTTNVIDAGQDNVLTGVNNMGQGQTLGSDLQDATDPKWDLLNTGENTTPVF